MKSQFKTPKMECITIFTLMTKNNGFRKGEWRTNRESSQCSCVSVIIKIMELN